ncbi:MAG: 16S rRNA (guanine(966)-N(2))-methyltransferase RsmD [bacterium]
MSRVRVIGGERKRAALLGPGPGDQTIRPTYDRVRESVFDLLNRVEGFEVLDLFAGTGSVGIEALSRGARRAVFVDSGAEGIRLINANLEKLRMKDRAEVVRSDVRTYIKRLRPARFDVIFIDPPYDSELFSETMELIAGGEFTAKNGVIIGQRGRRQEKEEFGRYKLKDQRRYGKTWITIWKSTEGTASRND